MTVLREIDDPDGRPDELTEERWLHILERHPEMADSLDDVIRAVAAPGRRVSGRLANEVWCYAEVRRPSRWIRVVVAYAEGRGYIVTAHARRSMP